MSWDHQYGHSQPVVSVPCAFQRTSDAVGARGPVPTLDSLSAAAAEIRDSDASRASDRLDAIRLLAQLHGLSRGQASEQPDSYHELLVSLRGQHATQQQVATLTPTIPGTT